MGSVGRSHVLCAVPSTLVVHAVDYRGSVVDGPGIRTVVFLQGCDRRCAGCHNPRTWDLAGGEVVPVDRLAAEIRARSRTRALTLSGGEPLLQTDSVLDLLRLLPGFSSALYTGYELHEVPEALLALLDYVKVGPFMREGWSSELPFVGSTNQRFVSLQGPRR